MKEKHYKLRGVQLDLARQRENMDFIRHFIDFIKKYDYNSLFLYLEGRIKTKSFPYPQKRESYSLNEIREVIEYAASQNIEVVPVVSTMGHAGMFLQYAKLAHLAELRDGRQGRFSDSLTVFCPSLKETYEFLEQYLSEVAEIFPSEYFHIGCDEVWDIGICPLCRDRAGDREGQGGIFARHICDIHTIITKKLGKKMIIWDDMFELYPEALQVIPRDIIMCCWHYDSLVSLPQAHFMNCCREDTFAKYDKMGFAYLCAPADGTARNVATFTEYASRYNPLGGVLTTWEKGNLFMYESYPIIAFAGRLWAGLEAKEANNIFKECIKQIFGIDDPVFINAVSTLKSIRSWPERTMPHSFRCGPVTELEYERERFFSVLADTLEAYGDKIKNDLGRDVFEDILVYLKRERLQHKLRAIVPAFYNPRQDDTSKEKCRKELKICLDMIEDIRSVRKRQWERYRRGITPCNVNLFYREFKNNIKVILDETKKTGLLKVYYFLPDMYSAQKVALFLKYEGEAKWHKITEGIFKAIYLREPFYCFSYPVSATNMPEAVRLETWGYGGQGFTFLEIVNVCGRFVPVSIQNVEGQILNPEDILINDLKWCFLGEKDTRRSCLNPGLAAARHYLEVSLARDDITG